MGLIDNIVDSAVDAFRFKDTVFYKQNSDLEDKYKALEKLNSEYPNNDNLLNELYIVKKGLDGENEIAYQLKKANIGMYVIRDLKVKYEDLTAQIDYVIITPVYTYYVECKNLIGNITVNEKGEFIREYMVNGKKIKKGMYSPLRQVEAQRDVIRKIWESNTSKFKKFFSSKYFEHYRRVLVVAANQETILNTSKAPKDIKYKVLRSDGLINQIKYDLNHRGSDELLDSKKKLEEYAQSYLSISINENIDYYEYYKNKFCKDKTFLESKLIELRKDRANKMNIPAYFIFTNDELEQIIELCPKTLNELSSILSSVKVNTHGKEIIKVIKENL